MTALSVGSPESLSSTMRASWMDPNREKWRCSSAVVTPGGRFPTFTRPTGGGSARSRVLSRASPRYESRELLRWKSLQQGQRQLDVGPGGGGVCALDDAHTAQAHPRPQRSDVPRGATAETVEATAVVLAVLATETVDAAVAFSAGVAAFEAPVHAAHVAAARAAAEAAVAGVAEVAESVVVAVVAGAGAPRVPGRLLPHCCAAGVAGLCLCRREVAGAGARATGWQRSRRA